MRCEEARRRLFDPRPVDHQDAAGAAELSTHLQGCARCAAVAAKLEDAQRGLRAHHAEHLPDPAFAARVIAELPDTTAVLGWAALRLLPAALLLAVVCSWYGATRGPGLSELLLQPDDPQLFTYVALGSDSTPSPAPAVSR